MLIYSDADSREVFHQSPFAPGPAAEQAALLTHTIQLATPAGSADFHQLFAQGLYLSWGRIRGERTVRLHIERDFLLVSLQFHLAGPSRSYSSRISAPLPQPRATHGLYHLPEPQRILEISAGNPYETVEVNFTPEYFLRLAALHPDALGTYADQLLRGQPIGFDQPPLPLTAGIRRVLSNLVHTDWAPAWQRLFLESQALELLALQGQQRSTRPQRSRVPNAYETERLHEAANLLLSRLTNPPTLLELARLVGLNDNKLKKGFRAEFGTTVFGLLTQYRMRRAQELLREGMPPGLVATEVGYSHVAHFSTAYKRYFGHSPTAK